MRWKRSEPWTELGESFCARDERAEPIHQQVRFSDKSTRRGGLEEVQALPRDALLINYVNSFPSAAVSSLLLLLHRNTSIYLDAPEKLMIK